MADFKYSLAVKGAEAIVAQLKMRFETIELELGGKPEHAGYVGGYKMAYYDAAHTLGELKYHEKMTARKLAKSEETL